MNGKFRLHCIVWVVILLVCMIADKPCIGDGVARIVAQGELMYLGVPDAAFVAGSGDGLAGKWLNCLHPGWVLPISMWERPGRMRSTISRTAGQRCTQAFGGVTLDVWIRNSTKLYA
jgi:hypothetical protein